MLLVISLNVHSFHFLFLLSGFSVIPFDPISSIFPTNLIFPPISIPTLSHLIPKPHLSFPSVSLPSPPFPVPFFITFLSLQLVSSQTRRSR